MAKGHKYIGWVIFVVSVLALVVVPFMIWGDQVDRWTESFLETAQDRPVVVAGVLGGLLSSDILFPVPSSIVSTGCGLMLGFLPGLLTSLAGMTVSCILGYWVGRICGRPAALKLVGKKEVDRFEGMNGRLGAWALVIARPIPVLAEVSVLFAGVSRMSFSRFLAVTTLSNLGVSAAYAAIGAYAAELNSFLLAFLGGVCVPGVIMLATKRTPDTAIPEKP